MFNVLHLEKVVKLDFIVRKDTPYRRREFERRKRVQDALDHYRLDPSQVTIALIGHSTRRNPTSK